MRSKSSNLTFQPLSEGAQPPYELLISADPSKDLVDEYLSKSAVFIAKHNGETVGVIVLLFLEAATVEIKNVAVKPALQGQGIGTYLIEKAVTIASLNEQKSICIGTSKSAQAISW